MCLVEQCLVESQRETLLLFLDNLVGANWVVGGGHWCEGWIQPLISFRGGHEASVRGTRSPCIFTDTGGPVRSSPGYHMASAS